MAEFNDTTQLISIFGHPDYDNFGESRPFTNESSCLIGFITTFLALSWIFVCLRLYVRCALVRTPGLDDLFVVLYLLFTSVASVVFLLCKTGPPSPDNSTARYCVLTMAAINFGTGRHFLLLTVRDVRMYLKLFYVLNINLNLAAAFIKLSLLFQFLRIFEMHTWPYRASVVGVILVSLWGLAFVVLSLFPCAHIPDAWDIFATNARCWGYASQNPDSFTATFVVHNLINTVFDIYITIIPLQMYFKPETTLRTRLGLMVLLLMGAIVVTLSAWRVSETIYYKTGWYPTHDPTWYGPLSILLMVLEINVASICASVPIFWPVISPYLGAIFVTREYSITREQREPISPSPRPQTGSDLELNKYYNDTYFVNVEGLFSSDDMGTKSRVASGMK